MSAIPGFLTKTFGIFSNPEYSDSCGWGSNGDTIVIKKIDQFSKQVLPNYFKHSNFQSFVRQLNMYDFHKTVQDPTHGEFQHQYFKQGRPDLLVNIKRKAHSRAPDANNSATKKRLEKLDLLGGDFSGEEIDGELSGSPVRTSGMASSSTSTAVTNGSNPGLRLNLKGPNATARLHLQPSKPQMESIETSKGMSESDVESRLSDIEQKFSRIANENVMLKRMVMDSRSKQVRMQDKMEKVLKLLYNAFVGNQGVLPPAAARSAGLLMADLQGLQNSNQQALIGNSTSSSSAGTGPLPVPGAPLMKNNSLGLYPLSGFSPMNGGLNLDTPNMNSLYNGFDEKAFATGSTPGSAGLTPGIAPSASLFSTTNDYASTPYEAGSAGLGAELEHKFSFDAAAKAIAYPTPHASSASGSAKKSFSQGGGHTSGIPGAPLHHQNSINSTSLLDDDPLAFSRMNSMEAWTMFSNSPKNAKDGWSGWGSGNAVSTGSDNGRYVYGKNSSSMAAPTKASSSNDVKTNGKAKIQKSPASNPKTLDKKASARLSLKLDTRAPPLQTSGASGAVGAVRSASSASSASSTSSNAEASAKKSSRKRPLEDDTEIRNPSKSQMKSSPRSIKSESSAVLGAPLTRQESVIDSGKNSSLRSPTTRATRRSGLHID